MSRDNMQLTDDLVEVIRGYEDENKEIIRANIAVFLAGFLVNYVPTDERGAFLGSIDRLSIEMDDYVQTVAAAH